MRPPKPGQGVVRRAAFQDRLAKQNAEIGVKMTMVLRIWYEETVVPLEARVAWLELPWWRRAWLRLKGVRPPSAPVVVAPGATRAGAAPEATTGGALDEGSRQE